MPSRPPFSGPAFLSHGFRPFFLEASLFALGVVPAWILVWRGDLRVGGPFAPLDWHIHEMLFGYAAAVIAGFLFTAVPNWTGRLPVRGWPLGALALIWALGRFAVAGGLGLPAVAVMAVDCAFLVLITVVISIEIVAGRNWRNLRVVIPVALLCLANVVFHLEVLLSGASDVGRRLGFAVILFLLTLIGGRIIPSFTRNWLVQRGAGRLPAAFGRFDALCLLAGAAALLAWTALPRSAVTAFLLLAAGILHLLRLGRWRGFATWPSPLLLMLHVAYAFVPAGMIAMAVAGRTDPAIGYHLFGIGAIGGMTVAVMARATRGHTGRTLEAGRWINAAFVLVIASALTRAFLPDAAVLGMDGTTLAAILWTAGFAAFCLRAGPWLALPNAARRMPSRPSPGA